MIDRIRARLSAYWAGLSDEVRMIHIAGGAFLAIVLFGTIASAIAG